MKIVAPATTIKSRSLSAALGGEDEAFPRRMRVHGLAEGYDSDVPPEAQLILACARTVIRSRERKQIADLLRLDLDWDYLIEKAKQNFVTPLLCRNLLNDFAELLPCAAAARLERYLQQHTWHNLRQTGELLELLKLLEAHDIPVLAFKGPTLAISAYGDLALRQFGDLDVLVQKQDVERAINLFVERGYQQVALSPSALKHKQKDIALVSRDGQVRLELHWRLSRIYFSFALDQKRNARQMWKRLEPVRVAGADVHTMPTPDLLLYLCLHGSKHRWERLLWICDIAELIGAHPELDWTTLLRTARKLGCERVLALGLLLAQELLGAAPPPHVVAQLAASKNLLAIVAGARQALFEEPCATKNIFDKQRYRLLLKERWSDKARLGATYSRLYLRLAFRPNEKDRELLPVPKYLSFVHYLVRPVRLSVEYSLAAVKRLAK